MCLLTRIWQTKSPSQQSLAIWKGRNHWVTLTFDFAPACPKAALFGAQAMWDQKHQLVEQNFTKSSFSCIHNAGSCARLSHSPNWWNRVYATSLLVQSCPGYPRVRAPHGFQSNTRLTHRFEGKFATCIANVQWCLRHCSDQGFTPCCCASATALPFQWCRISCPGAFQSTKLGGPTIMRNILRKTTSSLYKSVESSRTCLPEGSPFRAQGNNKPKLISTLTTSASQIQ